jgi:uncharacterized protein (TIGR02453 family)
MLQKSTFQFLSKLKNNNNKVWFDANRKLYEAAKQDVEQAIAKIIPIVSSVDEAVAAADLQVKQCGFRIHRDVRFSKDKSPYKINMGMQFGKDGKKMESAHYYIHIQPGGCFMGGGMYMPMAPQLQKIRQEIDYNFKEWKGIVESKAFTKIFGAVNGVELLSRPPKGYEANNPALHYLKMKGFIGMQPFTNEEACGAGFGKLVQQNFKTLQPMIAFINRALHEE